MKIIIRFVNLASGEWNVQPDGSVTSLPCSQLNELWNNAQVKDFAAVVLLFLAFNDVSRI